MLNFWEKFKEKSRITSPKKCIDVAALGPQYDGPLRFFDYDCSDIVPLEKCRLTLNQLHDIYENKTAYIYFKSFLESKMVVEVLLLYDSILHEKKTQSDSIMSQELDEEEPRNGFIEKNRDFAPSSSTFNSLLSRLPEDVQTKLTQARVANENSSNNVDMAVLKIILNQVLLDNWVEFIQSEWYFRYQVDLLTNRSVTLGDILYHETALSYFRQFLEIEGCSHIIEFWLAAKNFKQFVENAMDSDEVDVNQIMNDAISIYEKHVNKPETELAKNGVRRYVYNIATGFKHLDFDFGNPISAIPLNMIVIMIKYLSLLATSPLGFNDNVRSAVEEAICNETNGLPQADSFELAVNIVSSFLRRTYLVPFLSSQHYVHMLSDLIRNSSAVLNHSPTSSVSECSVDSKKVFRPKFDPDTIWRRRKRSGLSFGHVDQLGRFQSDIEPDPDRSSESKISKIMKKWVQRGANRVEEEMAWQVAKMVVKDITDLTMGSHLDNFETEGCIKNVK